MKFLLLTLLRIYRIMLSPLIGRWCRYEPTCSCYGIEAIEKHGWWFGGWMVLARLLRCRPGAPAGYDPIIEQLPQKTRWYTPWRACDFSGKQIKVKR